MPNKISDLTQLTGLASSDEIEVLDVSDMTYGATGTNKRITWTDILTFLDTSLNITGVTTLYIDGSSTTALKVGSSNTLIVDTANGYVGIGKTPTLEFEVQGDTAGIALTRTNASAAAESFIKFATQSTDVVQLRGLSGGGLRITNGDSSTEWARIDSSGNGRLLGYLNIGSVSAPTNTTAGDLTFIRGFGSGAFTVTLTSVGATSEMLTLQNSSTSTSTGSGIVLGNTTNVSANANGITKLLAIRQSDGSNDLSIQLSPGGAAASTTQLYMDGSAGGLLSSGYLRVGSTSAPTNTTAGDITGERIDIGQNTSFSASNGYLAKFGTTLTDTSAGAKVGVYMNLILDPASSSGSEFRTLYMSTSTPNTNTQNFTNVLQGGYFEVRHLGTGNLNVERGVTSIGAVIGYATYAGIVTKAVGGYFQATGTSGNPTGGTITTAIGVEAGNATKGSGGLAITTQIGVDVVAQTNASTSGIGIRIAAPSGATNNYALQLSDTGGTSAGGVTFGTDVQLYRSAANELTLDDRFIANGASNVIRSVISANGAAFTARRSSTTANDYASIGFAVTSTADPTIQAEIRAIRTNAISAGDNDLLLMVSSSGSMTEGLRLDGKKNVSVGTAALATNATDGFLYIPTCAGAPSGTPTAKTGLVPMVYDSTNNNFYIYNGAWKKVALA